MKRIMGMLRFQNLDDAVRAMDILEDAGYKLNIRHRLIDVYSAVFMEAWRYIAPDADEWAAMRYTTNSTTSLILSPEPQMMSASSRKASHMTSAP